MGRWAIPGDQRRRVCDAMLHPEWYAMLTRSAYQHHIKNVIPMVKYEIERKFGKPYETYRAEYQGVDTWSDHIKGVIKELFKLPDESDIPDKSREASEGYDQLTIPIDRKQMKALIVLAERLNTTRVKLLADVVDNYIRSRLARALHGK